MKHSKFLGVLAATLCLGLGTLASCGDNPGEQAETSEKHKHEAAPDAEWKADDNNHWHECKAGDGAQVDKAKHTADETKTNITKAATCTEAGSKEETCSVCGKKYTVTIKATGHTYAKDAEGEDVVTWTKEATCTEAGEGTKECTRCHETEAVTKEALGHDIQLIGDGTDEPEAGKAKVRMYGCTRCDVTYLGFKATEVTAESRNHLTFTGEGADAGAAFWGRPIGNAIALDENGTSVNQQGDECVYDKDETGDFFEYVFDLTQEQVNELGTCRLYCDAKPANYLSGDFWGRDQQGEDWTRGFYIDDADEHIEKDAEGQNVMIQDNTTASRDVPSTAGVPETNADGSAKMVTKGKAITDARYILYVDNEVKAFESIDDIPCPVQGSSTNHTRTEYVMPYTFTSLKVGENRISLRMAGGYRSTFYNFTFRSVEAAAPQA